MAQLPPKIPNMTPNWPSEFSISHHQKMPSSLNKSMSPNANAAASPSWVDEFLNFSSARRGAHRRSASVDSVTFMEAAPTILLEQHFRCNNNNKGELFERFDDEQFMSMFTNTTTTTTDEAMMKEPPAAPSSTSNPSTPSDHNSINEDKETNPEEENHQQFQQLKHESDDEDDSQLCKQETSPTLNDDNNATTCSSARITDPKRVKRYSNTFMSHSISMLFVLQLH